jgi:hypothetical protein
MAHHGSHSIVHAIKFTVPIRRKKEFIEYTTLADGIFLMLACVFVYASRDIVSLAFLGSTIAIAIGIGYAWFKLEK